ncbi:MAG TPA: flavin reductase [Bacillota bacterium]|jgi:flavin reductase (DIM6/NTAB) family NADH-FMN oxidoreductase RutF|nr:flavin reductase [Bacillota bacterium]HOL08906.1 flavin reductase [Bacillota bacterium]HPO96599.1 flavin reductase [Bacillota bacterium]
MKKWRCTICGYIHVGDEPIDVCPVCGAGPEFFEEVVEPAAEQSGEFKTDRQLQDVLFKVPCGIFVVSSISGDKVNGMINNTLFQITDAPFQVILGMDKRHLTTEYIKESNVFAVNFIGAGQMELVKRFGFKTGREIDKFKDIVWDKGQTGAPLLKESPGYLECKVNPARTMDAGTHLVFLAEVIAGAIKTTTPILSYQEYRARKDELWKGTNG